MATITLPDGRTVSLRVPIRGSEMAALDDARMSGDGLTEGAAIYRALSGAAADDATRAIIDEMGAPELGPLLGQWFGVAEDDALPPASGTSSGTP